MINISYYWSLLFIRYSFSHTPLSTTTSSFWSTLTLINFFQWQDWNWF